MQYLNSDVSFVDNKFNIGGRADSIEIDLYSDTHFGSKNVDEPLLKRHIKETKEKNRYWIFLGDGADCILPGDRRFDAENLETWAWDALKEGNLIHAEYDYWEKTFSPIADKCIAYLKGDGRHSAMKDVSNCRKHMLERLKIPGPFQLLLYTFNIYRDEKNRAYVSVPLAFHHGKFSGRMSGGKINNLERVVCQYFPEVWGFFVGHGHTKVMTPPIAGIIQQHNKGKSVYRRAAMTGGYLRTYAEDTVGYGERELYPPSALGRITVRLTPFSPEEQKRIEIINI